MEEAWTSHVFFHPALARAWVDTYLPLQDMRPLFAVVENGGTTAVLPLVLWRRNWKNVFLREVIPVGYSDFDYHDPILVGEELDLHSTGFWTSLIAEINQLGVGQDGIQLTGIRAGLAGEGGGWGAEAMCPFCDISRYQESGKYLPSLKASLRGDLRRQMRRLEEQGCVGYHVYQENELHAALEALPGFLDLHALRWPNAYKAPDFHANILRLGHPQGVVHFSELRLNDQAISWHLGFVDHKRYYYYLPAIDPAFQRFSPGKVHLLKCVEDAIRRKMFIFDHLRGEESYKSGWTEDYVQLKKLEVVRGSMASGVKRFLADHIKPMLAAVAR